MYADEDGVRVLVYEMHANGMNVNVNVNNGLRVGNVNGMNDNASNELRVRNLGDLNELHVVNGLGRMTIF